MTIREHEQLGQLQLEIARHWFRLAEDIDSVEAQFFFCYTAFNALFFYWRLVDGLKNASEHDQIENLLRRLGDGTWRRLSTEGSTGIGFFVKRPPIEKMDERDDQNPLHGDPRLGERHQRVLRDTGAGELDKLIALGKIIYIVRCNLCHGSKGVIGDDMEVIGRATGLLRLITDEAIRYTGDQLDDEI